MKVTKDKIEGSQAFLTVEMEPAEVEDSLEEAYQRLVKKTNVPGFRKGKAPRVMLERHIGRESLLEDALNTLIPRAYEDALKEQEIEAFARADIEITQTEPLVFKATVPLPPTVKPGDYASLRLTPQPAASTEGEVDSVIDRLRHQQASWEPVEREVGFGDLAVFDVESTARGKTFINQKGVQYQVLKDYPAPLPGFAEQLVGMERDGAREFSLQIPTDYPDKELAGKEAHFKVALSEVKQERLPELDDEFARGIDPKFETMTSLRREVADNLRLRAEERARLDFEEKVIEAVVGLAEVEFPPFLVDMETSRLLDQRLRQWRESGQGLEEYLASINKTEEELKEELRPPATQRVMRSLVLDKVAQEEEIEASDAEIDGEIEDMAGGVPENRREEFTKLMSTPQSRQSIEHLLVRRKTVQRLVEIARTQDTDSETTQKEAAK
ncbi:MAG TPA: trigger factor [Dehalococcoidia bacterium]|nr:trigger factor [Dehalococcoidia bacterium]